MVIRILFIKLYIMWLSKIESGYVLYKFNKLQDFIIIYYKSNFIAITNMAIDYIYNCIFLLFLKISFIEFIFNNP